MSLLSQAIDNNIHLCRAVTSCFGIRATISPECAVFTGGTRNGYPSVITRTPRVDEATMVQIAALPKGAGVKDSFAALDLAPIGFTPVCQAHWIARQRPDTTGAPLTLVTAETLDDWCQAWGDDDPTGQANFTPELLTKADIAVLGTDRFDAGLITNRNAKGITGLSNIFGPPNRLSDLLTGLPSVGAQDMLVGYETDPAPFFELGFAPLGLLTIWVKTG